ncbi:MAG: hypothetical protein ACJAX3_001390 [Patiriisocius sp.]|jgi:hypothetical protein
MVLTTLSSCLTVTSEIVDWTTIQNTLDYPGNYYFLEDNGVNVYFPNEFEKFSSTEYLRIIDSLGTKEEYNREQIRIESLQDLEGTIHLFFDEKTRALGMVNTMPYTPFNLKDAKIMLGMLSSQIRNTADVNQYNVDKQTAKYSKAGNYDIFKAIYRLQDPKTSELFWYNAVYVVSANKKTVMININTSFMVDFDPFILKTKM